MPFIQTKLSLELNEEQKLNIQELLTDMVGTCLGKPKSFVMAGIEDNQSLYMGGKKLINGAYLSISLLGNTNKQTCGQLTKNICDILQKELNIDAQYVYISYHSTDLWGWNGQMF